MQTLEVWKWKGSVAPSQLLQCLNLTSEQISTLDVLNIQPLTPVPGLDRCLYDLPSMRQRNLIKYALKQLVLLIKYSLHAIKIYIFDSLIINISNIIVGVVLWLLVKNFGGFKD